MRYKNGSLVEAGHRIRMWDGLAGLVVITLNPPWALTEYSVQEWQYLRVGIVVLTDEAGLVHYERQEGWPELLSA